MCKDVGGIKEVRTYVQKSEVYSKNKASVEL